jgi:hypothetical protein
MSDSQHEKSYPVQEAIRAQQALRHLAGLEPEMFPIQAFVGMISDEVEALRKQGHSDAQIAKTIQDNSKIKITADEVADYYASPEERHAPHD